MCLGEFLPLVAEIIVALGSDEASEEVRVPTGSTVTLVWGAVGATVVSLCPWQATQKSWIWKAKTRPIFQYWMLSSVTKAYSLLYN